MSDPRPQNKSKAIIGGIVGIILAIIISVTTPPETLGPASMRGLGIFVCAIVWWIMGVMPEFVTGLAMLVAWVVFGAVKFPIAFASFTGTTWWLLIGAMGMGVAVTKSGLVGRLALLIMDKFSPTYKGQTLALLISGLIIGPTIPSSTAKAAIVAPFATAISDNLGFERKSEGAAGLFAAMLIGFVATAPMFLSSSFIAYALVGLLPIEVQQQMAWMPWAENTIVWGVVVTVLSYFAIRFLYKPSHDVTMSKEVIREQLAKLGPLTKNEKIVMVVLIVSLLFWMTQRIHNIDASLIALAALVVFLGFNVINKEDFRTKISWETVVFIGTALGLNSVLPALKIDKWIAGILGPYILPLAHNIPAFIIVISILIYLARALIVDQIATITIFGLFLMPIAVSAGINPWVPLFIIYVSVGIWYVIYQHPQFLAGMAASDGLVEHPQMVKMAVAYMIISIIGLLASIPVWHFTHLIP